MEEYIQFPHYLKLHKSNYVRIRRIPAEYSAIVLLKFCEGISLTKSNFMNKGLYIYPYVGTIYLIINLHGCGSIPNMCV